MELIKRIVAIAAFILMAFTLYDIVQTGQVNLVFVVVIVVMGVVVLAIDYVQKTGNR